MEYNVNSVIDLLSQWKVSGMRELENGTQQICHVPHVAPQAWLHTIYNGLTCEKVEEFEKKLQIQLPEEYKEFLLESNGINVFSDSLSIWGCRNSYKRAGDDAIQPYDIVDMNKEHPKGCPESWLFFGSYSWDGSRVMFDLNDKNNINRVYRCSRRTTQVLQEWPSFWVWITSEIERIGQLFDIKGIKYDRKAPTV